MGMKDPSIVHGVALKAISQLSIREVAADFWAEICRLNHPANHQMIFLQEQNIPENVVKTKKFSLP